MERGSSEHPHPLLLMLLVADVRVVLLLRSASARTACHSPSSFSAKSLKLESTVEDNYLDHGRNIFCDMC